VDVVAVVERGNQSHEKKADDYHEGPSFHVGVGWLPPDWRGHAGMEAWRGRMARGANEGGVARPGMEQVRLSLVLPYDSIHSETL
jgi:hypothetical protein